MKRSVPRLHPLFVAMYHKMNGMLVVVIAKGQLTAVSLGAQILCGRTVSIRGKVQGPGKTKDRSALVRAKAAAV